MQMAEDQVRADKERVSTVIQQEIEQFLFMEARLLDQGDYKQWLTLLTDDIHYWMPIIENRLRDDPKGTYGPERVAYFDDTLADLAKRVARFVNPTAWAEDPATRHVHVISNIEVEPTSRADEVIAYSVFVNYRNRGERDQDMLFGRRHDVLRKYGPSWLLAQRHIFIAQNVLLSKNINTFL